MSPLLDDSKPSDSCPVKRDWTWFGKGKGREERNICTQMSNAIKKSHGRREEGANVARLEIKGC